MRKFMFLLREDLATASRMTPEQVAESIARVTRWVEELATGGHFISGEPLEPEARLVTQKTVLSDGPFIDAKDGISGYFIIQAAHLEQATAIAQTCPELEHIYGIEVRPVMEMTADEPR